MRMNLRVAKEYTIYGEEGKNIMDRYDIYRIVHKNKYVT